MAEPITITKYSGDGSGPALDIQQSNNGPAIRIHQEGSGGNALEIVRADGTVMWSVGRDGASAAGASTFGGGATGDPNPAPTGSAFVKEVVALTGQSGPTFNLTIPAGGVAAGNTLVLISNGRPFAQKPLTVSDTRGNVWTMDAEQNITAGLTIGMAVWSAPITNALLSGDKITVIYSASGTASEQVLAVYEFNGLLRKGTRVGAVVVDDNASGTAIATPLTGTLPSKSGVAFLHAAEQIAFATLTNVSSGYVSLTDIGQKCRPRYKILTSDAPVEYQGTWGGSAASAGILVVYTGLDTSLSAYPYGVDNDLQTDLVNEAPVADAHALLHNRNNMMLKRIEMELGSLPAGSVSPDLATRLDGSLGVSIHEFGPEGVIGDGEVNPATGARIGTNQVPYFQQAVDFVKGRGGNLKVGHAGVSQFRHSDGSRLDKEYILDGTVTVPRGVGIEGIPGSVGANQNSDVIGAYATSVACEVPPSSSPTLAPVSLTVPAFILKNANYFHHFCFHWPDQIKGSQYQGAANPTQPIAYPAGVEMQGHDQKFGDIVDYNSYILLRRTGGSVHTVIDGIWSCSHKTIIRDDVPLGEWTIQNIHYNNGTIYNSGYHAWSLGPTLDLKCAGPCFLRRIGMNHEWLNSAEAIRIETTAFGVQGSDWWIDTTAGLRVIYIGQHASLNGGNNAAAIVQLDNIHDTRGNSATYIFDIDYPDGNQVGGANQCQVQVSNSSIGWAQSRIKGGAFVSFNNCELQAGLELDGTSTGGLGQRIQIIGGGISGEIESVGGKNFVRMSGHGLVQRTGRLRALRTAGSLVIEDGNSLRHVEVNVPAGQSIPAGANVMDYLVTPWFAGSTPARTITVWRAEAYGGQNGDTWDLRQLSNPQPSHILVQHDTLSGLTGAWAISYIGEAEHDRSAETSSANATGLPFDSMKDPVAQFNFDTGTLPIPFEIRYNNNAGAPYVVPATGLKLRFSYSTI